MPRTVRMNAGRMVRMMAIAGVTPDQLAKDAGVGEATISRACNGHRLYATTWRKIAMVLTSYPADPVLEELLLDDGEE